MCQHLLCENHFDQLRDPTGEHHDQPRELPEAFEQRVRAGNFNLWCHVCDGLTTYEAIRLGPKTLDGRYHACPTCGLFATVQDVGD